LLAVSAFMAGSAAYAQEPATACPGGLLEARDESGLNPSQTIKLSDHVEKGRTVRVRVFQSPADADSTTSVFWFTPISIRILNGLVFAESPPMRWGQSAYTWTNTSVMVEPISYRVGSNGQLEGYQPAGDAKISSERAKIDWCLL
jgi:hypothetical protein